MEGQKLDAGAPGPQPRHHGTRRGFALTAGPWDAVPATALQDAELGLGFRFGSGCRAPHLRDGVGR
eukprot:scaffold15405_cov119-Isochrysis_galbana.AAC.7